MLFIVMEGRFVLERCIEQHGPVGGRSDLKLLNMYICCWLEFGTNEGTDFNISIHD